MVYFYPSCFCFRNIRRLLEENLKWECRTGKNTCGTSDFSHFTTYWGRHTNTHTYQPFVPGINDCIEHGLIEETIAHPLWYDDVYSLHRQLHLFHLSLDNGHNWRHKNRSLGTDISLPDPHVTQKHSTILKPYMSPHDWIPFTHHHPACWPWQFLQRSLRCCCTLSIKTKARTFEFTCSPFVLPL